MNSEPIQGGKYFFNVPHKTIILPITLENLPSEVIVEGYKLLLKPNFHVSLVCIGKIIEKHDVSILDFERKVVSDFSEFVKNHEMKISRYTGFRFSFKDDKKTLITMCEVSHLPEFFDILNDKYDLSIEYPPTHVTIYAIDGERGIFLIDKGDVAQFSKPTPNPIGVVL